MESGKTRGEGKTNVLTEEELLERIRPADVVVGVDSRDGQEIVYYGRESLLSGAKGRVVKIPVNYDTDEADLLAAACVTAKGSCEYGKPGPGGGSRAGR
jgi:hypothetical protein